MALFTRAAPLAPLLLLASPTPAVQLPESQPRDLTGDGRVFLELSADAAEVLPRFTLGRVLTDWGIDPIPFVVTIWAVGLYAVGVGVLRRRGDRWPIGRTLSFAVLGMGSFALAHVCFITLFVQRGALAALRASFGGKEAWRAALVVVLPSAFVMMAR